MLLKQIFAREAKLRGQISNFQGTTIRPIVPRHKHSIVFLNFLPFASSKINWISFNFFRWKPWKPNAKFEKENRQNPLNTISSVCFLQTRLFMHQFKFQRCAPGQPWGICSRCQSGGGAFANFFAARGLGISVPQGDPRAFDTRVFERWLSLLGRTRPLSKSKVPAEGKQLVH